MSYCQKWLVPLVLRMAIQCPPVAIAIMSYHTVKYYWTKAKLIANIYGLTGNSCPSRHLAVRTLPQAKLSGFAHRG
jgi:hypothetical protein